MTRFAVILLSAWLALSLTPPAQQPPSGLGVAIAWQRGDAVADAVLGKLHPPLWMDWVYNPLHMATDDTYYPMAWSLRPPYAQQYIDAAADMPGRFWLIGNEPNCCGTEIDPADAAQMVQRWRDEIGGEYACCGVTLWAGWDAWMNAYLEAGGPIPPYWHIHLFDTYAYPPVVEFRAWMQAHDAVRPIIVSEAACPWCSADHNAEYMTKLAQMVADGQLQAVFWYSAPGDYWHLWPDTDLMDWGATELTPLGEHWLSLQLGGANDPYATPTPEPTNTPERVNLYLPTMGKGL